MLLPGRVPAPLQSGSRQIEMSQSKRPVGGAAATQPAVARREHRPGAARQESDVVKQWMHQQTRDRRQARGKRQEAGSRRLQLGSRRRSRPPGVEALPGCQAPKQRSSEQQAGGVPMPMPGRMRRLRVLLDAEHAPAHLATPAAGYPSIEHPVTRALRPPLIHSSQLRQLKNTLVWLVKVLVQQACGMGEHCRDATSNHLCTTLILRGPRHPRARPAAAPPLSPQLQHSSTQAVLRPSEQQPEARQKK